MDPQKNNRDSTFEYYIQNAHDHLFRESMQNIEICREIATIILPSSILYCIDWKKLEIVKGDWIDEKLKEHRSDVLYRAKLLKMDRWVDFLFEHKSVPDIKTQKKLLRYIVEVWDQQEKQDVSFELLPVVISILVYHGNAPWKIANSIKPLIAIIGEIEEFVPDFRTLILDLSIFDVDRIADSKLKMFLLALKYSRKPDIFRILPEIIRISEKVQKSWDDDYLKVVLTYLGSVIKSSARDEFLRIIAREHRDGEVYMETIADALRKEERLKREKIEKEINVLRKEIEQKVIEIEKKDTALYEEIKSKESVLYKIIQRMLKKDMSLQSIREITGMSNEKIEQIKNDNKEK